MKIIDFANASMPAELTNNIYHKGQDRGFLMGLENLQEILEGLLEDEKQDHRKLWQDLPNVVSAGDEDCQSFYVTEIPDCLQCCCEK